MIHTILESGDKKNKIGDEFNTILFSTIFHIKRKKETKKERKKPNTPNWTENGHLEYVKYDSCSQSKIFCKKKKWPQITTRTAILTRKEEATWVFFWSLLKANNICFFVVCFQQTPEKNSCRFLFWRENCRFSSYLRSFFLFTEDFLLCEHKTYKYFIILNMHTSPTKFLTLYLASFANLRKNTK